MGEIITMDTPIKENKGKKVVESDSMLPAISEILDSYHILAQKRDIESAKKIVDSTIRSNLGYSIMKCTLETAISLTDSTQLNGELERLPDIVKQVYALTPEKTKEMRLKFLDELKTVSTFEPSMLAHRAFDYYLPTHAEYAEYVISLSKEEQALIVESANLDWKTMIQTYPRFSSQIEHFVRVEKQFNCKLHEYLPPPSR